MFYVETNLNKKNCLHVAKKLPNCYVDVQHVNHSFGAQPLKN